jgi:hypothetical protein
MTTTLFAMKAAGLGLFCGLAFACGGGGGGGDDLAAYFAKLRSCELISEGRIAESGSVPDDQRCLLRCIQNGSCADLQSLICTEDTTLVDTCFEECAEDLMCDGGTVKGLSCDGFPDCEDESDEANCPTFGCTDGSQIPEAYKCDGEADCPSGNDESNCPAGSEFTCDNGEKVPASFECDGEADCEDSSDEPADCAQITCPEPAARVHKRFLLRKATHKPGVLK